MTTMSLASKFIFWFGIGLMISAVIIFILRLTLDFRDQRRRDAKDLAEYRKTYRHIWGPDNAEEIGEKYTHLFTYDGGKHWIAINRDGSLLGDAEKKLPKELGMLRLSEYAWSHGPIQPNNPEGIQMLKKAGFTVKAVKS